MDKTQTPLGFFRQSEIEFWYWEIHSEIERQTVEFKLRQELINQLQLQKAAQLAQFHLQKSRRKAEKTQ
jgi:hypothetical protein